VVSFSRGAKVQIPIEAVADLSAPCRWHECCSHSGKANGGFMNRLLIVAILAISTVPLYAEGQQQSVAKLKADARNLVGIIGSDKTKTQTFCQIDDLSEQLDRAVQKKDSKKAKALAEKIAELNKKLGPEFVALVDIVKHVDLNSPDGQEIASIIASLGESCAD
jgi:hypothetical protein